MRVGPYTVGTSALELGALPDLHAILVSAIGSDRPSCGRRLLTEPDDGEGLSPAEPLNTEVALQGLENPSLGLGGSRIDAPPPRYANICS